MHSSEKLLNRRRIIRTAVGLILCASVAVYLVIPGEPRYEGRVLSAWLAEMDLESSHPQDEAWQAVRAIGTNGLPWLRRMLRCEGPVWQRAMVAFNANQSLIQLPITPDNVVRNRALRGYHALGNVAEADVPYLIQMLQTQRSARVRSYVALALGNIGPAARAAVPALEKATMDSHPDVRRNAFWALANVKMWVPNELPVR